MPLKVNTMLKRIPLELGCYGLNVMDLDIHYKKSQIQASAYYKEATEVDEEMCEEFHKKLNEHPEQILKQLKGDKNSPFNKGLKAFTEA